MDLILVCLTDKIKAEFLRFSFYQKGSIPMPLVTTTEMFKKAYEGGYAIGAFNVNNMEIIQGIVEAATEEKAPLILQVSAGARKYANTVYLKKMVEAAVETSGLPIALHLDHGDSFALCKDCVDSGFTSVMIDASAHPFAENISTNAKITAKAATKMPSHALNLNECAKLRFWIP